MDKNVGSVDLEELKKAREELNQERGIETDPNMYADYNPNREESVSEPVQDYVNVDSVLSEPVQEEPQSSFEQEYHEDSKPAESFDNFNVQSENVGNVEHLNPEIELSEDEIDELVDDLVELITGEGSSDSSTAVSEKVEQPEPLSDFSAYDSFSEFEVANSYAPPVPMDEEPSKVEETAEISEVQAEPAQEVNEEPVVAVEPEIEPKNEEDFTNPATTEGLINFDSFEVESNAEKAEDVSPEQINEITENSESENLDESKSEEDFINPATTEGLINFEDFENPLAETESSETEVDVSEQEDLDPMDSVVSDDEVNTEESSVNEELLETEEDEVDSLEIEQQTSDAAETYAEKNGENADVSAPAANRETSAEELTNANVHNDNETEIIGSFKQLEELLGSEEEAQAILSEIASEEDQEEQQEIKKPKITFAEIEDYKFVDVISTDTFTNSNKLSYVLGKNESGELVFGNLRDSYNVGVFGKETTELNNLIHSMLLSLIMKNSVNEINFIICDSKADSKFEVYNKSSYMYFNRIAKTNKEILDTLIELSKELEERYKLLAEIGVKSIEQYNTIAKNDNLKPLPYLLTVFNNYSKSIQLTNADKINACLHQILKFGRIVGLYLVIVANTVITSGEINYNLPTRLSFVAEDVNRSLTTLGVAGAESLPSSADILYSSVEQEKTQHLKVAHLTKPEIELLIENIEE